MSYSHEDKPLVERLLAHLRVLQTCGIARIFCDLEIRGGERWRAEIEKEIDGATLILCLLSADYLSSTFVNSDEVPRIRKRQAAGVRVVPVLLHPCPWQVSWVKEHQVYMQDGKPLDLGTPEEIEQHFAELTLEMFNLLTEVPEFDPPAAALPDAPVDTATEAKGESLEETKILQAGDRFRRKAFAELRVRRALQRLLAQRRRELLPGVLVGFERLQEHFPMRIVVMVDTSASMQENHRGFVTHDTLRVREDRVHHIHIQAGPLVFTWTAADLRTAIRRHHDDAFSYAVCPAGTPLFGLREDRIRNICTSGTKSGPDRAGTRTVYTSGAEPSSGWSDRGALASPGSPYYWAGFSLQGEWRWEAASMNERYYDCVNDLFDLWGSPAWSNNFPGASGDGEADCQKASPRTVSFATHGGSLSQAAQDFYDRTTLIFRGGLTFGLLNLSGTHGFFYASGAAPVSTGRVTVSLWNVDDGTVQFATREISGGDWSSSTPVGPPWARSHYWSGFSFRGEWRSVSPVYELNYDGFDDFFEFRGSGMPDRGPADPAPPYPSGCWSPAWSNNFTGDASGNGS